MLEPPLDETCGKGGSDGCDVSPTGCVRRLLSGA